ncbi:hypothetical protein BHE90_004742 [Fusarium euwallaceae]|uniref:Uncharacterized protein n=2 Tax=Fusarium solani species complex TaxID=232080 RepID=A0A3M2S489_9HYPO|nr:hypothetical protein CDV36_007971 [Fusarium kuroshium]RTE80786.1 hypothetical protein BHE90_004742 [Fusarium euwallaceae]
MTTLKERTPDLMNQVVLQTGLNQRTCPQLAPCHLSASLSAAFKDPPSSLASRFHFWKVRVSRVYSGLVCVASGQFAPHPTFFLPPPPFRPTTIHRQ